MNTPSKVKCMCLTCIKSASVNVPLDVNTFVMRVARAFPLEHWSLLRRCSSHCNSREKGVCNVTITVV